MLADTTYMAITLGAEIALSLHLEHAMTYGAVESALVDAGFDNYTISRNVSYDGSTDIQIFVRGIQQNGQMPESLEALDTMSKLTAAFEAMEDEEPDAGAKDTEPPA